MSPGEKSLLVNHLGPGTTAAALCYCSKPNRSDRAHISAVRTRVLLQAWQGGEATLPRGMGQAGFAHQQMGPVPAGSLA